MSGENLRLGPVITEVTPGSFRKLTECPIGIWLMNSALTMASSGRKEHYNREEKRCVEGRGKNACHPLSFVK